jgi:nitrogenase molybdenum-iron protein alpha chain
MSSEKFSNVPPIRDNRLNTIITFGGDASELVDLTAKKCVKAKDRSFSQTTFCQEWLAMLTLATIKDTVTIIHAPVGCSSSLACISIFNRFQQILRGREAETGKWISTNLTDTDAIHGGGEKLEKAIRTTHERYNPQAIFVFSSCVSGIIGEDIDAAVTQLASDIPEPIIPVYCDGFKSKVWASGYDGSFQGALNYLIKAPEKKQDNLVNIINPITFGYPDEVEVERLLNKIGIEANFIPNFNTVEGIGRASEAALTSSLCTTFSEYFAKELEKRHGVPYTEKLMPTGLDNTDAWLREIAGYLGKEEEAEELIAAERKRVQPKIDEIKKILKGKRAFVSAGQSRAIGIPNLLADLGIEIIGITAYHYDEVIHDSFAQLEQRCGNFCTTVANVQPFEQANILQKEKPDFYFGHMGESVWATKEGIPTAMVFNLGHLFVGYNGVVTFGERIINLLNNPRFSQKLSEHVKTPYHASWYNENPFKYHKEEESL